MLEPQTLAVLCAVSVATGAISAVVGMGGGITLLALMLLWLDPLVAIPVHGAVQLVSNASRAVAQRRHVDVSVLTAFGLPLLPMSVAGLSLAQVLPRGALEVGIGAFVLIATWRPAWLRLRSARPRAASSAACRRMLFAGSLIGSRADQGPRAL
jgi:uncharacterized membrane protein YfcA